MKQLPKVIKADKALMVAPYIQRKHPFVIPFITLFGLMFVSLIGFFILGGQTVEPTGSRVVELHVDGKNQTIPTRAKTVGEFLARAGIVLQNEDVVEPMLNSPITDEEFSVNVYRARLVTVIDDSGRKITAKIAESTPDRLATKAGIELFPEDIAKYDDADRALQDGILGQKVIIDRATVANLNLYGNFQPVRTQAETVQELLTEKGIKLVNGDTVTPAAETPLTPNIQVFILGEGKKIATFEEPISPPVETRKDATIDIGKETVLEAGTPGMRVVTYEIDSKDGSRKEIQSVVVKQPKKRVVIAGAKKATFEGGFEAALARLRACEGAYSSNTGNGYYGAYQFNLGSWRSNAPAGYKDTLPSNAPPDVQDLAAQTYYQKSGWRPWPGCTAKLGLQDIYR